MSEQKILIDAFGCDNPDAVIDGIAKALNQLNTIKLAVVGDSEYIQNRLKASVYDASRLEIINASEIISNDDVPVAAVRQKKKRKHNTYRFIGYSSL